MDDNDTQDKVDKFFLLITKYGHYKFKEGVALAKNDLKILDLMNETHKIYSKLTSTFFSEIAGKIDGYL